MIGPRNGPAERLLRSVVVGFLWGVLVRETAVLAMTLPAVSAGERASGCPEKLVVRGGSNCRPSAFQEALLIHVDPSLAAEQA
jgi:hypothetical protein